MINKPFSKDKTMEQNKENVQEQPKKGFSLKKALKVAGLVGLGVVGTLGVINYKGCRTTAVDFVKGIKFPWKKTATPETTDELPQTEPTQAKEYRQNYNNNRRDGYQQNRRPQWNNN